MEATVRVVWYVKQAPGFGILMSAKPTNTLQGFCDADWGTCINSRRSITGYMIMFGNSFISWKSKKLPADPRSLTEAEYRSLASTVAEGIWLIGMLRELGIEMKLPVNLYCDCKAALKIASNPVFHERTNHIDIDCHFIRENIQSGLVHTLYLSSVEQAADILTKVLSKLQHDHLVSKLGMKNIFIPPSLKGGIEHMEESGWRAEISK